MHEEGRVGGGTPHAGSGRQPQLDSTRIEISSDGAEGGASVSTPPGLGNDEVGGAEAEGGGTGNSFAGEADKGMVDEDDSRPAGRFFYVTSHGSLW